MDYNDDRTVIRPMPGGRNTASQAPISNHPENIVNPAVVTQSLSNPGIDNPLENAASSLMALLSRLQLADPISDPDTLQQNISQEIRRFQERAQTLGVDRETVYTARYVLCTVLDEAVLNTPWGQESHWAQSSLLSSFHKEVSGGEKFFHLLKSLANEPSQNKHILELMYVCLAMGFEGRYRIVDGGQDKLNRIRQWLYQILQTQSGSVEQTLSPHIDTVSDKRNALLRYIPLWVVGALLAALLGTLFTTLLIKLNTQSDVVFKELSMVGVETMQRKTPEPEPILEPIKTPPKPILTLRGLLADEINTGLLSVSENEKVSTVTIQGDGLFGSGVASLRPGLNTLIDRIADSMNQIPGSILVTGHSDNVPIRSARFPSNWHLSRARADTVAQLMRANLDNNKRINIEGKADLAPLMPNTTREGRAKNRRVEIHLRRVNN